MQTYVSFVNCKSGERMKVYRNDFGHELENNGKNTIFSRADMWRYYSGQMWFLQVGENMRIGSYPVSKSLWVISSLLRQSMYFFLHFLLFKRNRKLPVTPSKIIIRLKSWRCKSSYLAYCHSENEIVDILDSSHLSINATRIIKKSMFTWKE